MSPPGIQRFSSSASLPASLRGAVVAIGNFDGVHRGHQAVLERATAEAARLGVPALVLTFEPHPRVVFRPDIPVFRLTSAPVRAGLLEALGFNAVIEQPFTREFASLTAGEFVDSVLVEDLGASHVVTGFDFHFGKDRRGTPAFLAEAGKNAGFGVSHVEAFCDEGTQVVSSSRIRETLAQGNVAEAAGLLGYRFTIEGEVAHGKKLGRQLGYPTANMVLPAGCSLMYGIYAVRFRRSDGSLYDGVASFGRRPTVDTDGAALLETHLFDFSDNLYGETCTVSFFGFLRGEEKFGDLDALVAQMDRDSEEARALLATVRPISVLDTRFAFPGA